MSEERIIEALKALRDADAGCEAGPEVEARLVKAVRRRKRAQVWMGAGAVGIAAVLAGVVLLYARWPGGARPGVAIAAMPAVPAVAASAPVAAAIASPASKPRAVARKARVLREVDTEFYPLVDLAPPFERGELVRVTVPASAMADVGLLVNPTHLDDPVQADILIGQEGLARAIRFVSYQ